MSFLRTADKPISREPEGSYCRGTLQRGNLRSRFLPAAPVALHGTSGGLKGPALNLSEDFETRQRRLAGRCRSRRVLLDLAAAPVRRSDRTSINQPSGDPQAREPTDSLP